MTAESLKWSPIKDEAQKIPEDHNSCFQKMLPPSYLSCKLDVVLTDRKEFHLLFLTSWFRSPTLPTSYEYVTWALTAQGKIQLSFSVCSRQHTVISHISLYSLAHLLAYFGKLQVLSFLGALSYGSHAEQAFITSHLNSKDAQLSRGAWCKAELGFNLRSQQLQSSNLAYLGSPIMRGHYRIRSRA